MPASKLTKLTNFFQKEKCISFFVYFAASYFCVVILQDLEIIVNQPKVTQVPISMSPLESKRLLGKHQLTIDPMESKNKYFFNP